MFTDTCETFAIGSYYVSFCSACILPFLSQQLLILHSLVSLGLVHQWSHLYAICDLVSSFSASPFFILKLVRVGFVKFGIYLTL